MARDPIIAAALQGLGVLLACLLPLVVCFYVLRHLGGDPAGDEALGELLVSERLTAEFHQPQPVEQEQRQRC